MAQRFKLKIGRLTPQEHQEFISELALDAVWAAKIAEGCFVFEPIYFIDPKHNV